MKILAWDIEATSLEAAFGRLLCCGFARISPPGVEPQEPCVLLPDPTAEPGDDSALAAAIKDEAESADILLSWNGVLYDAPFVNARLAAAGLEPLQLRKESGTRHIDLMYYAGGQSMRLGGRRLMRVSEFFHTGHAKTPLTPETWARAAAGSALALEDIVEHCAADVEVLRDLWPKLAPFVRGHTWPLAEIWQGLAACPGKADR